MYLLLFISVLFKFADGCVDVYLFSILERNDECVLEFVRNATFAAQHLVVIGSCAVRIFVDSAFFIIIHVFQSFQSFVILGQRT